MSIKQHTGKVSIFSVSAYVVVAQRKVRGDVPEGKRTLHIGDGTRGHSLVSGAVRFRNRRREGR